MNRSVHFEIFASNPRITSYNVCYTKLLREAIRADMADYFGRKKAVQPVAAATCGCAFKNPEGESAGRLLDRAGFRGVGLGGVAFSELHANFLVNTGGGRASEALELIALVITSYSIHYTKLYDGVGEITVFCSSLLGAGLGFLWFNAYPAQVFMGDVGSLSLGGALGIVAVMAKQELLLVVVGGLFVIETLSVIVQVGYFKMTGGKRIFRMAPLHHHFEMKGIPESKIIIRFWIISVLFALVALSTLKLR